MVACNFDMQFIFAIVGWEGSSHDTRIFLSTQRNPTLNFPKLPRGLSFLHNFSFPLLSNFSPTAFLSLFLNMILLKLYFKCLGKYYLVDAGYRK